MKETRCIICGEKRNGLAVRSDRMIAAIRWVKRNVTKNEKSYNLVVCRDCFLKYKKARDGYQRKQATYTAMGLVFAVLLLFVSGFRLSAFAAGAAITAFMYLLSQLSYMPGVSMPAERDGK